MLVMRRAELMRQVADLDDQREAIAVERAALQRERDR
jgi:cell division protein FtsB